MHGQATSPRLRDERPEDALEEHEVGVTRGTAERVERLGGGRHGMGWATEIAMIRKCDDNLVEETTH